MSWLAPFALVVAAVGAAGVVLVHLITRRRPPPLTLPTTRFVPVSDAQAIARARRPEDLPLLLLRALAVLLIGAAFALPVADAPGPSVRSVVLLDVSSSVADAGDALRRAQEIAGEGGGIVAYDTAAREWTADSLRERAAPLGSGASQAATPVRARAPARALLSSALVAARVVAARIARGADSVRLVVVSPLADGAIDAATRSLREGWPGRVELERVRGVADSALAPPAALVPSLADDPLAPALAALPVRRGAHAVRVTRAAPTSADLEWARARDRVLVHWPQRDGAEVRTDGVAMVEGRATVLVAPLARTPVSTDSGRVIARWRDGAPAALERVVGAGCVRRVGIGLPDGGDLTLRASFRSLLIGLVAPCGGARGIAIADSSLDWLTTSGPLASAHQVASLGAGRWSDLAPWLLGAALALLLGEWWMRSRGAS